MSTQIEVWREYLRRRPGIAADDVDELEAHLRDQIDDLTGIGLSDDEAFMVAVTRVGRLDTVSREFAREHSERLWKQLVFGQQPAGRRRPTLAVAIGLAVVAAIAVKVPTLFGVSDDFFLRNVSLLVLPWLAAYFLWERRSARRTIATVLGAFAVAAMAASVYPLSSGGAMEMLVAVHLPVVGWFVVALAYVNGAWRDHDRRMDFVRFTGEWVVYYVLIALGGGTLIALAYAGFQAIGMDAEPWLGGWVLPCGAAGAVVIAAWLVEAKQAVVENIAPVLTAVFTPLTAALLGVYLVALLASGDLVRADRELLILADVILVLVLGLVLYAISARDPLRGPGPFDRLQLLLIVLALAVDLLMLVAMSGRIAQFGATPNKLAALGLNLILLVNLSGAAWRAGAFLRGRCGFAAVERWQTAYLPVFAVWVGLVVVGFPLLFGGA